VPACRKFSLTVVTAISRNDRRCGPERTDSLTCLQRQGFFEHAIKFRTLMAGPRVMQKFGIVSRGCRVGCIGYEGKLLRCLHHQQCMPAVHASTKVLFNSRPKHDLEMSIAMISSAWNFGTHSRSVCNYCWMHPHKLKYWSSCNTKRRLKLHRHGFGISGRLFPMPRK